MKYIKFFETLEEYESWINIEENAEDQSNDENAGGAQVNTLDGDAAQCIAQCGDDEHADHQKANTGYGKKGAQFHWFFLQ